MDEEVYNDNNVYKWYERSMVRIVNGTKSPDTEIWCPLHAGAASAAYNATSFSRPRVVRGRHIRGIAVGVSNS